MQGSFNPIKVNEIKPTAATLDCLAVIQFLTQETIESLKSELPLYLAKAADVSDDFCPLS